MTPEEAAFLAKNHFYAFPKLVSGLQCPRHIKFISDKVQEKIENKSDNYKLLLISCPPRHGKSLLISKHLPAWYLGKYPEKRVILTSYSSELSDENSDYAKEVFAKWGPILWDSQPSKSLYNRNKWNTTKGGGCVSAGIGGSIIGFGADLFIVDDYLKGVEEASSKDTKNKLWEKWQGIIGTRLHPGCLVICLATRWASDDLMGRLVDQKIIDGDEFPFDYEYINIPALIEDEIDLKNDPLHRKMGEALWPKRYSPKLLMAAKKIVGSRWWNAEYKGRPSKEGGNLFKSEYFRYYTIDAQNGDYICCREKETLRVRKNDLKICTIVDPALDKKKKSDPVGMHSWGYSRKHRIWVLLDRFNEKMEHKDINKTAKIFSYKNDSTIIYVENEKLGKIIVKQSEGDDKINNRKIPFKEVATKGMDKYARATPMASYCEDERVFFPKNAIWLTEFEKNLKDFPSGSHDEDADLTAYASIMEDKISVADVLAGRYK